MEGEHPTIGAAEPGQHLVMLVDDDELPALGDVVVADLALPPGEDGPPRIRLQT
jgi:hypothetical protein